MISNYLPYIFGATSLLLGIFLFLRSFKIYKPKNQTQEQIKKSEDWDNKFGTWMKIISILLILKGGYNLFVGDNDQYKTQSVKENTRWTKEARGILIQNCLRDSGPVAVENPEIMKEYCECSVDNIMKAFSQKEYEQSLSKSREEQMKEQLPYFKDCLDESQRKIDSVRNK